MLKDFEISIEESDVFDYLAYFLFKHYDCKLVHNKICEEGEEFRWCLEYNFYTYAETSSMLTHIENLLGLLESDKDESAKRVAIVKNFPAYAYGTYREIDLAANIFDGYCSLSAVTRFYKEFCALMRNMMSACPQCDLICFEGP